MPDSRSNDPRRTLRRTAAVAGTDSLSPIADRSGIRGDADPNGTSRIAVNGGPTVVAMTAIDRLSGGLWE